MGDHVRPMSHARQEETPLEEANRLAQDELYFPPSREGESIPEKLRPLIEKGEAEKVLPALASFIRWDRNFKKVVEREESQLRALVPELEPRLPISLVKEWLQRFEQILIREILKRYT